MNTGVFDGQTVRSAGTGVMGTCEPSDTGAGNLTRVLYRKGMHSNQ